MCWRPTDARSDGFFSPATLKFRRRAGDIGDSGSSGEIIKLVRSGQLHAGVVALGDGLPDHNLDGLAVMAMPPTAGVGIAVNDAHPFAARDALDPAELVGQRRIGGLGESGEPQFVAWPSIDDAEVPFLVRAWQARMGMVAAGLGIAVVPAIASRALPRGVQWVPVRSNEFAERRCYAITTVERPAGAMAFVRCMRSALASLDPRSDCPRRRWPEEHSSLIRIRTVARCVYPNLSSLALGKSAPFWYLCG